MIVFFGKGEIESDTLIKDCLKHYFSLSQSLNLNSQSLDLNSQSLDLNYQSLDLNSQKVENANAKQIQCKTPQGDTQNIAPKKAQVLQRSDIESVKISRVGKPHFENLDLSFSLSHSKGVFILAFSEFEVGADIELVREINFERFEHIIKSNDINEFFSEWTKCEALGKYFGSGVSYVLGGGKAVEKQMKRFENLGGVFTQIPMYKGITATIASMPQEIILVKVEL